MVMMKMMTATAASRSFASGGRSSSGRTCSSSLARSANKHARPGRRGARMRCTRLGTLRAAAGGGEWSDVFTELDDRRMEPPKALPNVRRPKRVVLVRHGQSTWNAVGRMQGSSDESRLTEKGVSQAQTTALLLNGENFDAVYSSPLRRARDTAEIVWGGGHDDRGDVQMQFNAGLREIDLYSFQGLLKEEAKERFPQAYRMWKDNADNFSIDGHYPVRELWTRASMVWDAILSERDDAPENILIVAHNAVNQALIGTALGLRPFHFRRFVQSNAATTVISILPASDAQEDVESGGGSGDADGASSITADRERGGPLTILDGLNETPEIPLGAATVRSRIHLTRGRGMHPHWLAKDRLDALACTIADKNASPSRLYLCHHRRALA